MSRGLTKRLRRRYNSRMKKRRSRDNSKTLSEFDMNVPHEKVTYDMVMFLTDKRWGRQRFRKEFKANFGKLGRGGSTGGYMGAAKNKIPRIRIANDVIYNDPTPRLHSESTKLNKRVGVGQFFGDPEYIARAVIAHQLAHVIIDTPYITINPKWKMDGILNGGHCEQWIKIYSVLRDKFVNPYVEHVPYDWKKEAMEKATGAVPFKVDLTRKPFENVEAAKMRFGIKDNKKLVCTSCGDTYIPERCPHGFKHMNDDGFCMDCHIEMNHQGIGSPEENIGRCGNDVGYPEDDIEYFPRICDRWYYGV